LIPNVDSEVQATRSHSIAKNATFSVVGTMVSLVAGIATSMIVARYLGIVAFGVYSLVQWTRITVAMLADIGLGTAVTKFVSEFQSQTDSGQANRLTLNLLAVQIAIAVPSGLALAFFAPEVAAFLGKIEIAPYLLVISLALGLGMVNNILVARLSGLHRFDLVSILSVGTASASFLGVVVVVWGSLGISGLLWVEVLLASAQLALLAVFSARTSLLAPIAARLSLKAGYLAKFCLGVFIITSFDVIVWQRSETFFLGRYKGLEEIAFYGMAYNIVAILVGTIPGAFGRVLMPALSARFGLKDHDSLQALYSTATKYIALLTLPLCAGGIALSTEAVRVMFGLEFAPAGDVMKVLFVGAGIGAMAAAGSALYIALGETTIAAAWGLPLAVINVLLALLLVPAYGAIGAAVANSLSQLGGVVAGVVYLTHFRGFRLPLKQLARLFLASVPVALVAYGVVQLVGGLIGLLLGVLAAGTAYLLALIVARALTPRDFDILEELAGMFPSRLAGVLQRFVGRLRHLSVAPVDLHT
jgi:O-antigen/teichoic acid export membrane protein